MDSNNSKQTPPLVDMPLPPVGSDKTSKANMRWLLIGVVLVLLILGGVYYFLSQQNTKAPAANLNTNNYNQPVSGKKSEDLESELNSVDAEANGDSDFAQIDADLQNL